MSDDFEVRDRRRFDLEGNPKEEYFERINTEPKHEKKPPEHKTQPSSEVFISFLMNLSAMAYNAMGLGPNPKGVNLQDAKYLIDVIGALEEKTSGNLTPHEDTTLKNILYELRMNYAEVIEKAHPKR